MKDRDPHRYDWFFKNVNGICCFVFYLLAVVDLAEGSMNTGLLWLFLGTCYLAITIKAKKNKKQSKENEQDSEENK